ncbi:MAG TPA: ROK family transcriptional regulator [Petrotogaceae bacterium]|nr:ROK family transcriptional regulator [Petrotogaceae bacterium]
MEELKILNKRKILKYIFLKNNVTRKELSQVTGLSSSSVTRLINDLIEKHLIISKDKVTQSLYGRKSEILTLNPSSLRVFIIDIDVKNTVLGMGSFDGNVKILKTITTSRNIDEFKSNIKNFIKLFNYKYDYVSFSIPGIVNVDKNIIVTAPNLGWSDMTLQSLWSEDKAVFDNDSNLCVLAEKFFSDDMQDIQNAMYILIKDGIGGGLILNGNLYRGRYFCAGEIGHNIIVKNNFKKSLESVFDSSLDKKESLEDLALNISYIVNILNLEKVIIGGKITNMSNDFFIKLKDAINDNVFVANRENLDIRLTNFNYEPASMVGACSNAVLTFIDTII